MAQGRADRLPALEVALRRFQGIAGRAPVTVSVGLVADRVADENVMHDLHSRADEALYAAKESGRNKIIRASQISPNE